MLQLGRHCVPTGRLTTLRSWLVAAFSAIVIAEW